jgi:hypothetical protein
MALGRNDLVSTDIDGADLSSWSYTPGHLRRIKAPATSYVQNALAPALERFQHPNPANHEVVTFY